MAIPKPATAPAPAKLMITAVKSTPLLEDGVHDVRIVSAKLIDAPNANFVDKTPQLEIVYANAEDRKVTKWYNLKGYAANPDGSVKIDENTGERIESPENTESCMRILGNVALAAGAEEGQQVSINDLVNAEVRITVQRKNSTSGKLVPEVISVQAIEA